MYRPLQLTTYIADLKVGPEGALRHRLVPRITPQTATATAVASASVDARGYRFLPSNTNYAKSD